MDWHSPVCSQEGTPCLFRPTEPIGFQFPEFPLIPSILVVKQHIEKHDVRAVRHGISNAVRIAGRPSCLALVVELRPDYNRVRVWTRHPLRMDPVEVLVAERNVKVIGGFVGNATNRPREVHRVIC
jgi:hypothetical protein